MAKNWRRLALIYCCDLLWVRGNNATNYLWDLTIIKIVVKVFLDQKKNLAIVGSASGIATNREVL